MTSMFGWCVQAERAELLSKIQEGESSAKLQEVLAAEAREKAQAKHLR